MKKRSEYSRLITCSMHTTNTKPVEIEARKFITTTTTKVTEVLSYASTLVGIPYRWHRAEDRISGVDKFYASNDGIVYSRQDIIGDQEVKSGKCIVCTGLINLMRKYAGLTIPGLDGSLGEVGINFPGTTGVWFMHLERKGVLYPLDVNKNYTPGTLLLRDFHDVVYDQGHVAVVIDAAAYNISTTHEEYKDVMNSSSVLNQYIIHSYSQIGYNESKSMNVTNVGQVSIEKMHLSHFWEKGGYYTHICYPEDWIIKD